MKKWIIQSKLPSDLKKDRENQIIKLLLKNRGITNLKEKEEFFNPTHPLKIKLKEVGLDQKQIEKSVKRIVKAIKNNEFIIIYGDYDADGITATAILWETLHQVYKKVMPYLPDRVEEGYGLTETGIDKLIEKYNPKLIITVDQGISANSSVDYANSKGIDVIISDHHTLPKKLPKAVSIVHTTKISGSSVSWFLAREFTKRAKDFDLTTPLDLTNKIEEKISLVAIGTVSDVLKIQGVNRSIVFYGVKYLRVTKRSGLNALFKEAGIKKEELDTYHIAYIIAPRINATGRITHALDSLRLICTTSNLKALMLAQKLGETNRERQKVTTETFLHAKSYVETYLNNNKKNLLFVSHSSYNQGIIGLVAGKLVEEYSRPAIVISVGEKISKASARSINGLDIISLIRSSSKFLINCGGHPMAAGFTIETEKISLIQKNLEELIDKNINSELLIKSIKIDCEIGFLDISNTLFQKSERFKPFGVGNREPLFVTKNVHILRSSVVGREGKHLKLILSDKNNIEFNAIAFNMGSLYPELEKQVKLDIVYKLVRNNWNGQKLELQVKDIRILGKLKEPDISEKSDDQKFI